MTVKSGKVWGVSKLIVSKPQFEAHRIEISAGARCSMHQHQTKYNAFYVDSGTLRIVVKKNSYDLTDVTVLEEGDYCEVPPGEYHRFEAETDVVAWEFYWSVLDPNDIVREDVGSS